MKIFVKARWFLRNVSKNPIVLGIRMKIPFVFWCWMFRARDQQAAVSHFPRGEIGSCCSQLSRICPVRALICFHWIYTAQLALTLLQQMWSANPIITRANGYKLDKYTMQTQNIVYGEWKCFLDGQIRGEGGRQTIILALFRKAWNWPLLMLLCSGLTLLRMHKSESVSRLWVKTNKRRINKATGEEGMMFCLRQKCCPYLALLFPVCSLLFLASSIIITMWLAVLLMSGIWENN